MSVSSPPRFASSLNALVQQPDCIQTDSWFLVEEIKVLIPRSTEKANYLRGYDIGSTQSRCVLCVISIMNTDPEPVFKKEKLCKTMNLWLSMKEVKSTEDTSHPRISLHLLFMTTIFLSFKLKPQDNRIQKMKPGTVTYYPYP